VSFATSTAVFNTTYNAQARIDAELTNGADVTVTAPTASDPGSLLPRLAALPGVPAAQSMQHRFAYVGTDLQDLFGIDPVHIAEVTNLSNAYFVNGDARATLAALSARPDGVLVAAERPPRTTGSSLATWSICGYRVRQTTSITWSPSISSASCGSSHRT